MVKIAPSILSIDFTEFAKQIQLLNDTKAEWLHFDVMDGHFVNNLTFGPKILTDVKKMSRLFCDVHIMVSNPEVVYQWFQEADGITFHFEAVENEATAISLIQEIQNRNQKAGISIKPDTDVKLLDGILPYVDLVLIMSVEPGHGGQKFLPSALDKITYLKERKQKHQFSYAIQVDGGINAETAGQAKAAGAEILVAGSYVFSGDIESNIEALL